MKRGDLEEDGEKFSECGEHGDNGIEDSLPKFGEYERSVVEDEDGEERLRVLLGDWGGIIIPKDRDGWLVRDGIGGRGCGHDVGL